MQQFRRNRGHIARVLKGDLMEFIAYLGLEGK